MLADSFALVLYPTLTYFDVWEHRDYPKLGQYVLFGHKRIDVFGIGYRGQTRWSEMRIERLASILYPACVAESIGTSIRSRMCFVFRLGGHCSSNVIRRPPLEGQRVAE